MDLERGGAGAGCHSSPEKVCWVFFKKDPFFIDLVWLMGLVLIPCFGEICVTEEGFLEDGADISLPESRGRIWRPEHVAAVRIQEHLRRGYRTLGDE